MESTYTLSVFNTTTGLHENVEVTKAVYNEYKRGEWRIWKNDIKHGDNEIPFSALYGGENAAYENFREFVDDEHDPLSSVLETDEKSELHKFLRQLSEEDRLLIENIYFKGMSERMYAEQCGIKQQTIHKKKERIIKNIKNIYKKGC